MGMLRRSFICECRALHSRGQAECMLTNRSREADYRD